jgi:nucleotide-binding universal stress UspA family protein
MLSFNAIVVPTDFSDHSLRALAYAIGLAEKYEASVNMIYVHEPALQVSDMAWVGVDERSLKEEHVKQAHGNIERIKREQIPTGLSARVEVRTGNAVDEIIRYADEVNADMIVMATHGRSGLSHILMGSTAEQVIRKASCPVLTLKHPMRVTSRPEDGS